MATLEIPSNVKCITSGQVPTTKKLKDGEFAFGKVGGVAKLYGNVNGVIIDFTGDDGGTIDANTLLALLSGSNGIEIAKNAAGDKVELKIPNEISISNSQGMAKLSPQTISLLYNPDNVSFLIDGLADGIYKTRGSEQQWYLHQDNVKTLFGNQQSIYGSGNIDLYRHSIKLENSSQPYCRVWFNFYSSSNTPIDSIQNLMNACADKGFILANGWNNKQQVIGISVSTSGLQYSYIYMLGANKDNWPGNDVPSITPLSIVSTITDTVTTV